VQLQHIDLGKLIAVAGGDPWRVNASIQLGNPGDIFDLAQAFHQAGHSTGESERSFQDALRRFQMSWNHHNGQHPINDSAEVQRVQQNLGKQAAQLPKIAADLQSIAATLAEAQRTCATLISTLDSQLHALDDEIGQNEKLLTGDVVHDAPIHQHILGDDLLAVQDTKSTLDQLLSIRAGYSDFLGKSLSNLHTDGYDPPPLNVIDAAEPLPPLLDTVALPPPNASPEEVHEWWTSLTPDQHQRVLAEHPEVVGNLNGVPVSARSDANTAVMNQDWNRVRDAASHYGVSVDDVMRDPREYGLTPTDVTRYQNADQTKQGLDHDADGGRNPVFLFAYDPMAFGGKGRAAIALGNPDLAKNTAVIVPGTGSSVKGGWLHDNHDDALNLYAQANAADPNNPTSVIAWMGYDAPNSFEDPRIATPALARTGGATLAADVNGLWTTHLGGGEHVTVIGHSYGSTTVADGFANSHMHASDAVLIGCPGTDLATSAESFGLDTGHVYVGDSHGDPVGMLGQLHGLENYLFGDDISGQLLGTNPGLGLDPAAEEFGAIRFRAEVPAFPNHDFHAHSHYYDPGSEALHSMADIASGHGNALGSDGILADPRHRLEVQITVPGLGSVTLEEPAGPAFFDPEADRPPDSIHNDHVFDRDHHH
jgi:Alpha/beta hydrolase